MNSCDISKQNQEIKIDPKIIEKLERKVKETIKTNNLITPKDKVLVAVSGGKDSTTVLHILKKLGYTVEAFTVDVHIGCYTAQNLENVKKLCEQEEIKLHVYSFRKSYGHSVCNARDLLNKKGLNFNSCTVCGVMRRRLFNMAAKKAGATKLATGHNMNDEVQSILMNIFRNKKSLNERIKPMQTTIDEGLVPRIKPLFFITEEEVIQYSKTMNFPVQYSQCPCAVTSLRYSIREFLKDCEKINPFAVENIMNFFVKTRPEQTKKSRKQLNKCTNCGEPAVTKTCRSCQILKHLEMPAQIG